MNFSFPYRREPDAEPSPAAPDRPVFRPKIPLRLLGPTGLDAFTTALVDSGADETVVPYSFAKSLDVKLDRRSQWLYAADGRPVRVRYGVVELVIARDGLSYHWTSKVAFQKDRPYSVLGFAGCLDRMTVSFDGPNQQVHITTPDPEGPDLG